MTIWTRGGDSGVFSNRELGQMAEQSDLQRSARVVRMAADAAESHGRDVQAAPSTARALASVLEELDAAIVEIARLKRAIVALADEMDRNAIAVPPSVEQTVLGVRSETPSRKVGAVKHPETVGPPISALQDRPNATTCRRCGGTGSVAGMLCSHGNVDFRDAYQREVDKALADGLTPEAAHELGLFATYLAGKAAPRRPGPTESA